MDFLKLLKVTLLSIKKAVSDSVAKQDGSTKDAKAKLDAYLKAYADF